MILQNPIPSHIEVPLQIALNRLPFLETLCIQLPRGMPPQTSLLDHLKHLLLEVSDSAEAQAVSALKTLEVSRKLETFKLSLGNLTTKAFEAICKMIRSNNTLKALDIQVEVTNISYIPIASSLAHNNSIKCPRMSDTSPECSSFFGFWIPFD